MAECRQSLSGLADILAGMESDIGEALARELPDITEDDVSALLSAATEKA